MVRQGLVLAVVGRARIERWSSGSFCEVCNDLACMAVPDCETNCVPAMAPLVLERIYRYSHLSPYRLRAGDKPHAKC